jgi:DNA segregation ATPase FtsK/SpoIIIE, S-DNA-T family
LALVTHLGVWPPPCQSGRQDYEEDTATDGRKLFRELFGLFLLFLALLMLLSLLTFSVHDPSLNHVISSATVQNKAGLFGAYVAGFLNDVFGVTAYAWPCILAALGAGFISWRLDICWWRWCGYLLLWLCLIGMGSAWKFSLLEVNGGGMLGDLLYTSCDTYLKPYGSLLLLFFALLVGTQLAFGISWKSLGLSALAKVQVLVQNCMKQKQPLAFAVHKPDWQRFVAALRALPPRFALKKKSDMALPAAPADEQETKADFVALKDYTANSGTVEPSPAVASAECEAAPALSPTPAPFDTTPDSFVAKPVLEAEALPPLVPVTEAEAVTLVYDEHGDIISRPKKEKPVKGVIESVAQLIRKVQVPFPSLDLLTPPRPPKPSKEDREGRGQQLVACLATFNVEGTLERITPGPVVTMYEYKPAPGIRVKKIEGLVDDLKLAMRAKAIRIQAPIPGSDTVGIEIPNEERETVNFREMLENETFTKTASPLTMVIGKDVAGRPFTADLAIMPHLLVAGATGAGKSVCINAFLMSFLYKARPEDMQLLLVDPKRVEMAVYADLPHLVHPIVTEMEHAKAALEWAVQEMEHRYDAMARLQVRNITGYNETLRKMAGKLPPELSDLTHMPYLVIIIDEFADLMMTTSRREVETSIVRLAQLARAAGIHMILATQRPSVDVVTGLIKANFPCRISFQVSQKVDSRTILDAMGAEALLGRGDMLFKPSGGRMLRMHGPFVSDDEVHAVVNYWKKQQKPQYKVDFSEWGMEESAPPAGSASAAASQGDGGPDDQLYAEILAFVNEQGKASISLIQRRFRIGFNKAARLFEQLERDGVVGPSDGSSRPRPVVK